MINIPEISKRVVPPGVAAFMEAYGGNHVSLYRGWKEQPEMKESVELLEGQLCYSLREKNLGVARRLLGRIRKIESIEEDADLLQATAEPIPELDCLS
ncbi:MAG: hypothetical protein KAR40_08090 [Candidatus Sabulitectum sp.]|nr:hypothetical protein [Candidatus Sabulitectum sp.]